MKNLAFLINNLSHGAGTERATCVIANGLADFGYKVSILSCREGMEYKFPISDKVSVVSLKGEEIKNRVLRKAMLLKRLKEVIDREGIEILVAVDVILIYYLLGVKAIHHTLKIIAWEHFNFYAKRSLARRLARRLSAKYADAIVVLGERDLKNYKDKLRRIKRIVRIYNPVTVSLDTKSKLEEKTVLAVGRLTRQKGFDLLLEAWRYIEPEFGDWKLRIIGDGEEKEALCNIIEKYNLRNVELLPYQKDIDQWYMHASIFALSSRYEGFVLVMIEAMAKGLPVVSFNCKEGPYELIEDGINGYLVDEGNIEGFAEKLKCLMIDEALREQFAEKTLRNLYKFDSKQVIAEWKSLIGLLREEEVV